MTKNQGIKVNLNTYKIKQISLWLAHWALLKCLQVHYILDKLTEIGFRYILCFPEDGNDIAITFSVRNKQTNKQRNRNIYEKLLPYALSPCNTVKPRLMATTVIQQYGHFIIWPLFWLPGKTAIHFLVKKPSLIRSSINLANLFWPISDHINGVPLYFQINQQSNLFFAYKPANIHYFLKNKNITCDICKI